LEKIIESKSELSPNEFLKKRRPERFTDSLQQETGVLDRAVLEHQLATLNKRNKELDFEVFGKHICEKMICPNLLEQTGPVAGGDGKVDTQTFPVSEQTKLLWYVGVNDNNSKDRWAFAVSTQEEWKSKCRRDVKKIKATERNYKKAFFITNQYTKANQRSSIEDSLTKETGIDVRILDISWILDQIFKNGYEQLAINDLSIDINWQREIKIGPNDYAKETRLKQLQEIIKEDIDPTAIKFYQIDCFLEVAVLSKELEIPYIESQGLFERAIKIAGKFGNLYHQFNSFYQYAWASYWWYEDIALFEEQLLKCIDIAKEIKMSGQWGDVVTLLGLYLTHCRKIKNKDCLDIKALRAEVKNYLLELVSHEERPSNSLLARAHIEILKLHNNIGMSKEKSSEIFTSLLSISKKSELLVGFPFQSLYNLISELDDFFGDLDSYEAVLDYFTEQATTRMGALQGARLWLKRGARRLDSNEPYQAIKLIGKSLNGLYKEEVQGDFYEALNLLSAAYQKVGLFWASRANLLLAASLITDNWWKSGDLISGQAYSYIRLSTIELLLGRFNYALTWWDLALVISVNLEEDVISERDFQNFDALLSQCILNMEFSNLNYFEKVPDALDKYQLFASRSMMLHALGYEDIVAKENEVIIDKEYFDYLKVVRDLDLGGFSKGLSNYGGRYSNLSTSVMGCDIKVSFPFKSPIVELAETLLSVLEGFFSTFIVEHIMVLESRLDIEITSVNDNEIDISHELDKTGPYLKMDVLCSTFSPEKLSVEGQRIIQEWLHEFIIEVFSNLMIPKDIQNTIESLLGDERALDRSISFGTCFQGHQNILGNDSLTNIKTFFDDDSFKNYKLIRTEPWDKNFPKEKTEAVQIQDLKSGEGTPPKDILDTERLTHRDIKVQSLIKIRLWDRTVWKGTGFAQYQDNIPELILLFDDEQASFAIFNDLEIELGKIDNANRLRVSIIRSIDKQHPAHYRIVICENLAFDDNTIAQINIKMNTMTPSNTHGIDQFINAYNKSKRYILSYGTITNGQMTPPSPKNAKLIIKNHLNIYEAWEIGPNYIESAGIFINEEPIIPDDVKNPPVIETLKRKSRS